MRRSSLSLILLMLPLLACNYLYAIPDGGPVDNPPVVSPVAPTTLIVTGDDFEAVVFSAELAQAGRIGNYTVFPNPNGYWTPSEADIQTLEANLETFLTDSADQFYQHLPPVDAWLPDYGRQYYGYERDGEQFIYGNFLCDHELMADHPNDIVLVEDGGDCFFQLHYNVATQEFFDLMVNGFA